MLYKKASRSLVLDKQVLGKLVRSFKLEGSFAEYRLFYRALLQKRLII